MRKAGREMKMMKTVSAVLFVLLVVSQVLAQQRWTKTYGGTLDDGGQCVQQTSDGNYIISGWTKSYGNGGLEIYLTKIDIAGNQLWHKTYGGAGDEYGFAVEQTPDRGYIIAGRTASFGNGGQDVYLIKTDSSGDTLWTRTYGGANDDYGFSVGRTSDGGYIVAGFSSSYGADNCVYLIKTKPATQGDTEWTRTYAGTGNYRGYSVQQTSDGGYIVAGSAPDVSVSTDVYLIKTDSSGDTLWTRTYGGTNGDVGFSVRQTRDSGYVIAGWTYSFGVNSCVYLIKTKPGTNGDTAWTRTYGGTNQQELGYSVQQTADGGYIIAGYSATAGPNGYDVLLIRTDQSGETLWTRNYGAAGADEGHSVRQTTDGGHVIAGQTTSFGAGGNDVYLLKTDANGSVGVSEPGSDRQPAAGSMRATPNPFTSFARVPGHVVERFEVYDASGKMVGTYRGNRIGEGLSPAVYFLKPCDEHGGSLRVVKAR